MIPLVLVAAVMGLVRARHAVPVSDLDAVFAAPSWVHPFGCGETGQDLFAMVAHAVVAVIALAAAVAVAGFVVGTSLGASAALAGGVRERAVARACDLLQAFPTFLLALVVLSAVRVPSRLHLALVFSLSAWAPFARLAIAETRILRGAAFVEAARALGASRARVLLVHVVPSLVAVGSVQLGASAAAVVVGETALGFIGLAADDGVSLGALLDEGVSAMLRAPHVLVVGALAVFVTSLSLLVAGRALGVEGRSRG